MLKFLFVKTKWFGKNLYFCILAHQMHELQIKCRKNEICKEAEMEEGIHWENKLKSFVKMNVFIVKYIFNNYLA